MKFKLDENFGNRCLDLFSKYGHNVETVRSQNLQGCSDEVLFNICRMEKRCLVTLDKDFSDIIRFPPGQTGEIIIVRPTINPPISLLDKLFISFLQELKNNPIGQQVWIVEPGRIRIHEIEEEND